MRVLVSEKLSPNKAKTPEGYLICNDAIIARTGTQEYMKCEIFPETGSTDIIKIDRTEDEVFSDATIASFENKPLTSEHPSVNVTPGNFTTYAVGYVRDVYKGTHEGKPVMRATIIVTDESCIEDIEEGVRTDLSCGYDCDIVDDGFGGYKQINIRGNHVALCEQGRAGIAKIVDSNNDLNISKGVNDSMEFAVGAKYKKRNNEIWEIEEIKNNQIQFSIDGVSNSIVVKSDIFEDWLNENEFSVVLTDSVKDSDDYDDDHKYLLTCYLKENSKDKSKELVIKGFKDAMSTRAKLIKHFENVQIKDMSCENETCTSDSEIQDITILDLPKEIEFNDKYILYKEFNVWRGTSKENYDNGIVNEDLVCKFDSFANSNDIIDYLLENSNIKREDIIVKTISDSFAKLTTNNLKHIGTYKPKYNPKINVECYKDTKSNKYMAMCDSVKIVKNSEERLYKLIDIHYRRLDNVKEA